MADDRTYFEKLKDPKWQKKRLEIMQRDNWMCQVCQGHFPKIFGTPETLNVHHKYYRKGADPWDYPDETLITLCEGCHARFSEGMHEASFELLEALKSMMFTPDDFHNLADAINRRVVSDDFPPFMHLLPLLCTFFTDPVVHDKMKAVYDDYLVTKYQELKG